MAFHENTDAGVATIRRRVLPMFGVASLALALRLWNLDGQSVTMDEVYELTQAKESVSEIIRAQDGFPPLYQLLLKGWLAVFGPEAARSFSVLCGMFILPVVWRIGRMAGGSATAWTAAFLVAISPIHVWYAQEARANALFDLLAVLAVSRFITAMTTNRAMDWLLYGLCTIAGLYTHYYFTLVVAGLLASIPLFPGARSRLALCTRTHAVVAVAALPWIWLLLPDLGFQSGYAPQQQPLDLKSLGYTLVAFLFGFSVGPSPSELHLSRGVGTLLEALPWAMAAVAVCLLATRPLWIASDAKRWALRLGLMVSAPVALCGIAASTLDLGFRVRYVAWGASLLLIILALGIVQGRRSVASLIAGALLVSLSALSLANRNLNSRYSNEDARGVAQYLAANQLQSIPVFVTSGYMASTVAHYLGTEWRLRRLPDVPQAGPPTAGLEAIRAEVPRGARFWLVYSRPWDGDPGGRLRDELLRVAGLRLSAERPGFALYEGRGW